MVKGSVCARPTSLYEEEGRERRPESSRTALVLNGEQSCPSARAHEMRPGHLLIVVCARCPVNRSVVPVHRDQRGSGGKASSET